jgi:HSP20 family protein
MHTNVSHRNARHFNTFLGWDPIRLLDELAVRQPAGSDLGWSPVMCPLRIEHDDEGVTITVDMPGVDAKDLDLTMEAGNLSIAGKRGEQAYQYALALGNTIDVNNIEAQLDKGVLTVRAHKRPETKPRKIVVGAGSQRALDGFDRE